eukprot:987500_1
MSITTERLKSSSATDLKSKASKHQERDSRHDWSSSKNNSMISKSDIWDEDEECLDSFCHLFGKLPMLNPFATFRCTWDVFVMFMLIYTSLEVPFTLGFHITLDLSRGEYFEFGVLALVIDICLCIDILFNFRTAYFDKYDDLRLITNPKRIAKRYFKGWFWIDFLTSFPFEFLILPDRDVEDTNAEGNVTTYLKMLRIFRLFRIFKILRLLKMVKLFDGFLSNIVAREMLLAMRLFKVLCLALLSAHMSACLWYAVGCDSQSVYGTSWIEGQGIIASGCGIGGKGEVDDSLIVRYSYSWYWSVVTLFTTGYGDVVATNVYEQWTASAVILVGTCLFGYFVGTITSLITEGDKVSSSIMNKLEDAQHFCQQKKLPSNMSRAVLTHTRYHCNHNYVLGDEQDVLSNLPSYLAMDVSLYISRKYLENLDFFGNDFIDPYIRGLIALKIKSISCNKGYKLFVKGDVAEKLYIQRIGKSNHFIYDANNPKKKPVKKKVSRGDVVGEYALVLKKRESTLVCETWCEFYVLDVADIKEVLEQHYQNIWNKKWQNICKFIKKEYLKPIRKRKRRKALLRNNPFLPSFRSSGDLETDAASDTTTYDVLPEDGDGDQGHVNWENDMNQKERKERRHLDELRQLERMTTQVLNANANDLNNNNINFGLNALSRNALKISQLSNKQNTNYIKSKIIDPLAQTTITANKTLFRGLTRNNSFLRDLEVTKDYHRDDSSSSSSGDEIANKKRVVEEAPYWERDKEEDHVVEEGQAQTDADKTMDVANFIEKQVQMMELHKELNKEQKIDDDDDDDDDGVDQMITNVYSDIGDVNVDQDDDELEEEEEDYEDGDSDYSQSDEQNENEIVSAGNRNRRRKKGGGGLRKKKKRKTQKAHS